MAGVLALALARHTLGLVVDSDWPSIAADALVEGVDSPSLRVLAGLGRDDWQDIRRFVGLIQTELGLCPPPTRGAAILFLARHIAQDIVNGIVTPYEGARSIWALWDNDEYPDALLAFVGEASQIEDYMAMRSGDPERYDSYIASCTAGILESAHHLLRDVAA